MLKAFCKAIFVISLGICEGSAQPLRVVDTPPVVAPAREGADTTPAELGESLKSLGQVYKGTNNELVQELWLLGRFQGQYHWTEASTGQDNSYETRRFRLGGQARMLEKLTVHAQMVSGSDIDPFYNGFTELWAQWSFAPELALTLGQQKNRFTHDRNVSSRYINYLERGMLTNMFNADYTPAITIQGKSNDTSYYTGFFTNATGQNMGKAFTEFDSGFTYLAALYHSLGQTLWAEQVTLHATYVHSEANQNATNLDRFRNGVSGAVIAIQGQTAVVTEIVSGIGSEDGNATGINFQPSYFFNHHWQLATRYQLAVSNSERGLQPQRRYERPAGIASGSLYQATYLGLNYYIAKHRLKLMSGVEYASIAGADSWTASTMVRFYFGPDSGETAKMTDTLPHDYD